MQVGGLVKVVKSIMSMGTETIDNWVFRLLYKYTTILLLVSAAVVFMLMRNDPVICAANGNLFHDSIVKMTEAVCLISGGILDEEMFMFMNNRFYFTGGLNETFHQSVTRHQTYYPVIRIRR